MSGQNKALMVGFWSLPCTRHIEGRSFDEALCYTPLQLSPACLLFQLEELLLTVTHISRYLDKKRVRDRPELQHHFCIDESDGFRVGGQLVFCTTRASLLGAKGFCFPFTINIEQFSHIRPVRKKAIKCLSESCRQRSRLPPTK